MHQNQKFQEMMGRGAYNRQTLSQVPPEMFVNAGVATASHGHCPFCGRPLGHQDMHPPGRATRHLCKNCYVTKFNRMNPNCIV